MRQDSTVSTPRSLWLNSLACCHIPCGLPKHVLQRTLSLAFALTDSMFRGALLLWGDIVYVMGGEL